jgi:tripartite-type tricarboxylate transporter receptor subunit TctC
VGPAGLPDAIARRLESAMADIVRDPAFRADMAAGGFGLLWRDSRAFAGFMREEQTQVRAMIRDLGL